MTGRWHRAIALAVGVVVSAGACADDGNDAELTARRTAPRAEEPMSQTTVPTVTTRPSTVEHTGVVVTVAALDNTFRPDRVEIDVGDEVRWENRGLNDHDVLYVDGDGWGVEVEGFGPGAAYAHVFTEPGEYRYYCSIHGNETIGMVGTVVVGG